MLKNYITIAFRNLLKQKSYSLINIIGLAIGITCFLIIAMLVSDEFSFDRFHINADRIYRLTFDAYVDNKEFLTAKSSDPLAQTIVNELPEVEAATHFRGGAGNGWTRNWSIRYQDKVFNENLLFFADSSFFKVFTCNVIEGDMNSFLKTPNTIIITDKIAKKYFGQEPALGKSLELDGNQHYIVSGVIKAFPPQSHWRFDFLVPTLGREFYGENQWVHNHWYTYALLKKGAFIEHAETTLESIIREHAGPQIQQFLGSDWTDLMKKGFHYRYHFQPLTSIHLHSDLDEEIFPPVSFSTILALIIVAVFILLIACFNFMNLSTARSARRAKEVGVRKSLGSNLVQLRLMFIGEAVLITTIALMISVIAVSILLPVVNNLTGKSLAITLYFRPDVLTGILLFVLAVGFIAGSYPAFILSSFKPSLVLKGGLSRGMRSGKLRSVLVITQFAVSIALIIGTMFIFQQLSFIRNKNLGFNKEHMMVIDNTWLLGNRTELFKELMLNTPGIISAGYTQELPGNDISSAAFRADNGNPDNLYMLRQLWCDFDYLSTMGIELKQGRQFNKQISSDSVNTVIINTQAAELLGYDNPLAHQLIGFTEFGENTTTIIGVTEDFHYEPLYLPISPMVISISHGSPTRLVMRVKGDIPGIMKSAENRWAEMTNNQPFNGYFLDSHLDRYYRTDQTMGKLIGIFAILGIFVSCLGILGLAAFAAQQRTKEIGIRKILGASTTGIIGILSREYLKLVIISNLIAWPVAWFFIKNWLQNFAYRIPVTLWVFVLAGVLALLIALITTSSQVVQAALSKPVNALRYE